MGIIYTSEQSRQYSQMLDEINPLLMRKYGLLPIYSLMLKAMIQGYYVDYSLFSYAVSILSETGYMALPRGKTLQGWEQK